MRVLDLYKDQIGRYRALGLDLAAIRKLINPQLERPLSYQAYRYYVQRDGDPKHWLLSGHTITHASDHEPENVCSITDNNS